MPDSDFEGLIIQWLEPSELQGSNVREFATLLHAISNTTLSDLAQRGILSCLLHITASDKLRMKLCLQQPQDGTLAGNTAIDVWSLMQTGFVATLRRCGEDQNDWIAEQFPLAEPIKLAEPLLPRVYFNTHLNAIAAQETNPHPLWDEQHLLDLAMRYEPDNCSSLDDEEFQMAREAAFQQLQRSAA